MEFDLEKSIEQLEKTPVVLDSLLYGVSFEWVTSNEGKDTWSAYDVVGHLIYGEKTDWIPRAEIILSQSNKGKFEPFDHSSQFDDVVGKSMGELLYEFQNLRWENVSKLKAMNLSFADMGKVGIHPDFGQVTLQQLIASWVAHDLSHLYQISRVLAKQLKPEVGPWKKYMRVLK